MGDYVNVGAFIAGKKVPTKKALKDMINSNPSRVVFYGTSDFDRARDAWPVYGHEMPAGVKFSVVGPDPFNDRKWYATVEVKKGKPVVS